MALGRLFGRGKKEEEKAPGAVAGVGGDAPAPEREEAPAKKEGAFARLRRGLSKTREKLATVLRIGRKLDEVFGPLPQHSALAPIADAKPPMGPTREIIEMEVPQSVAQFGHRAFPRKDDDFIAAYILNYIIGGGGFSSRLMEEVREKRGLAYSVHSNLYPYQHGAVFVGNVATQNERVGQSLEVIETELKRLAEEGPSAEELAGAKSYLTGAYALRFESSSSIANQLLWIQIEDLGIDYVNRRNDLIEQVSLDDIKRVANRLIEAEVGEDRGAMLPGGIDAGWEVSAETMKGF